MPCVQPNTKTKPSHIKPRRSIAAESATRPPRRAPFSARGARAPTAQAPAACGAAPRVARSYEHRRGGPAVEVERGLAAGRIAHGGGAREALREVEEAGAVAGGGGVPGGDEVEGAALVAEAQGAAGCPSAVVAVNADAAVRLHQPRRALHHHLGPRGHRVGPRVARDGHEPRPPLRDGQQPGAPAGCRGNNTRPSDTTAPLGRRSGSKKPALSAARTDTSCASPSKRASTTGSTRSAARPSATRTTTHRSRAGAPAAMRDSGKSTVAPRHVTPSLSASQRPGIASGKSGMPTGVAGASGPRTGPSCATGTGDCGGAVGAGGAGRVQPRASRAAASRRRTRLTTSRAAS